MRTTRRTFTKSTLGLLSALGPASQNLVGQEKASSQESKRVASGRRAAVATVHPLASRAAVTAFTQGGNAFDAAVAASLMLSVVDGFNSGLGGGCLAMLRDASGKIHAIDGRETAPGTASPAMFYSDGKPNPSLSQTGPLAAGCPGLLAALHKLSSERGVIGWQAALQGAAKTAADGFTVDANYHRRLKSAASKLKKFPASAETLLNSDGSPWPVGHKLQQRDLAKTLDSIGAGGLKWFYEGEFAKTVDRFMESEGGRLSADDFAAYETIDRKPISSTYRNFQVFGFPPPSSGGIHIAQMLGMLEKYDLRELFNQSEATARHLLLEVMKRAMADRAYWLGDMDFTSVPRGLLDPAYLAERASSIDLEAATSVASHGTPPRSDVDLFGTGGHTTHLTTADKDGNVVAITQTINTTFGSKMIVPGTGVVLNNELDDFSIAPGVRNAFGLLGSKANVIAPGKRPLSSMSPTLVTNMQNEPVLSCGAAGGPKIITAVLQVLLRVMDLTESIDQAIAAPRVHHQWSPNTALCEVAMDQQVVDELRDVGHAVSRIKSSAVSQGLQIRDGVITAASDPRVPSSAMSM